MGWSFECGRSRLKDFIAERCREQDWVGNDGVEHTWRCLAHKYVMANPGNGHLWKVIQRGEMLIPSRRIKVLDTFIALDLIQWGGGKNCGWGYKDLSEYCGPCEIDCPLKYLEMTDEPKKDGTSSSKDWAAGWREKVRVYHASRARARRLAGSLRPGDRVYLKGCTVAGSDWVVIRSSKPLVYESGGMRVRGLSPRKIDFDRTLAEKTGYPEVQS